MSARCCLQRLIQKGPGGRTKTVPAAMPASGDRVKAPAPKTKPLSFVFKPEVPRSSPGPHIYSDAHKTYLVTE